MSDKPAFLDLGRVMGPQGLSAFEVWCAREVPPVDPEAAGAWAAYVLAMRGVQGEPGADGLTEAQVDARVQAGITGKQDALTFDATPTDGSANPVTSGGVHAAIAAERLTVESEPIEGSTNPISSGGVQAALAALGLTDTGWVEMTMGTAVTAYAFSYRARHGVLYLGGYVSIKTPASGTELTTSTIPTEYMPTQGQGGAAQLISLNAMCGTQTMLTLWLDRNKRKIIYVSNKYLNGAEVPVGTATTIRLKPNAMPF